MPTALTEMTNRRVTWLAATDPADAFPDTGRALREPNGLLAAGGDLSVARLLVAYRKGIFPWYEEGQPILWWSPDPRCVMFPADLHVSRRLAQQMRKSSYTVRFNASFNQVIEACAAPRRFQQGTWITTAMMTAFARLHREGWAHSVEIWDEGKLVGGLYGIGIGRIFFGESMFSSMPNASKMALAALIRHMRETGMELLDCQVVSRHLESLGATMLPRNTFEKSLRRACEPACKCVDWPMEALPVADLDIS